MIKNQRNDSLDIIKGFCCILMVIAHQPYYLSTPEVSLGLIHYLASAIPPELFFAIAGVTATFQAKKYSLSSLFFYFLAMFIIGTTWNIGIHGDISAFRWPEIFQTIALGSFLICIVERNAPASQPVLLTTGIVLLFLKPAVRWFWPHFDGGNFLFCDSTYTPDTGPDSSHATILPGFPFFPATAYFFLGVWSYRAAKNTKLIFALTSLGFAVLSAKLGSDITEKWDTSIAYSLVCTTVIFSFFWLFHAPVSVQSKLTEQLRRIGSDAFLFFFSHPIGVMLGGSTYRVTHYAYISWTIAITVSILTYNFLSRRKPAKIFESGYAWLILMAMIMASPLIPQWITNPGGPFIVRFLALVFGITSAVNFPLLSRLVKKPKHPAKNADAAQKVYASTN